MQNSPFNIDTLTLCKDFAKITIFANGRNPKPMREHANMLKVVGFIQNKMGISLQGNPRYEWMTTVKTELEMIQSYHNNYDRAGNVYKTAHSLTKMKWGRTVPANNLSLNIMHRPTRHAFCNGIYADKDMVNAHSSILCEAFKYKPDVNISALMEYNSRPKYWRNELALHHGLDPEKNKDAVKQLFIRILFGGKYEEWIKDFDVDKNIQSSEQHSLVLAIQSQLDTVRDMFYTANPQMVKDMKKHDPVKFGNISQLKRSLLATALQTIERWMMEACVSFLISNKNMDLQDIVPCQDGCMILSQYNYEGMEADFERVCYQEFGMNIKWADKLFDEAISIPKGIISKSMTEWFELITDEGIAQEVKSRYGRKIQYRRPKEDIRDALYVFDDSKKRWFAEDPKKPHTLLNYISGMYDIVKKQIDADDSLTEKERQTLSAKTISFLRSSSSHDGILKRLLCILEWSDKEFDADPYLLGFENGYINLRTYEFDEYEEEIHITLTTGYHYRRPNYECEADRLVRDELTSIFNSMFENKDDVLYYLQIMASGLDGINYQKIWFFEGAGGNGKGLGLSLNECVLGNVLYKTACGDILSADGQKANQSSEDIMNLKNARMAVFNEMDKNEGMTWSSLKVLTGGDTMTGRRLYKGIENFKMSCSVIGAFNNKPDMVGHSIGDERASLQRRLKPIHFPFIFTEDPAKKALGLPYKEANPQYVEPSWRLSVRDVYLDLLCTEYARAFSKKTNTFVFNEPEKVRIACESYLQGEDLFLEIFNELYLADPAKIKDIPDNRLFVGGLYEQIIFTETFRQGANGKGRKAFLRSWSKKKFIEWCQSRLGAKTDRKEKWYICGYSRKDFIKDSIEEEVEEIEDSIEEEIEEIEEV